MASKDQPDQQSVGAQNRSESVPLIVDLDGTLISGDSLWESFFALPKVNLGGFFAAAFAVRKGRAALKDAVSSRFTPSFEDFCFNPDMVEFARAEAAHRPVVLATAANERLAQIVADGLGFFSEVIASGKENRKSGAKLDAVRTCLKQRNWPDAFDYAGDHKADRPLWAAARNAYVVAPSDQAATALTDGVGVTRRFDSNRLTTGQVVSALRPRTWPWALLAFLPFFLTNSEAQPTPPASLAFAFISLLLVSIGSFLINDVLDLYADRRSPAKRGRMFATGALNIPLGVVSGVLCSLVGVGLAFSALPVGAALIILSYPAIAKLYSLVPDAKRSPAARLASAGYAISAIVVGALTVGSDLSSGVLIAAIAAVGLGAALSRFVRRAE